MTQTQTRGATAASSLPGYVQRAEDRAAWLSEAQSRLAPWLSYLVVTTEVRMLFRSITVSYAGVFKGGDAARAAARRAPKGSRLARQDIEDADLSPDLRIDTGEGCCIELWATSRAADLADAASQLPDDNRDERRRLAGIAVHLSHYDSSRINA